MYFYNYEPIWDLLQIFKWWWNADPRELNSVIRVFVEWFFFSESLTPVIVLVIPAVDNMLKKQPVINFFFSPHFSIALY